MIEPYEHTIYRAAKGFEAELVDELGGESEAVRWLEQERKVDKGLRIVDWRARRDTDWSLIGAASQLLGGGIATAVRETLFGVLDEAGLGAFRLDGLVSVWHPSKH